MKRYSAKLLFQWDRHPLGDNKVKYKLCEERIITYTARSNRSALTKANRYGAKAEFQYPENNRFTFIGIVQLMELGAESGGEEVWWDLSTKFMPLERIEKYITPEEKLYIFTDLGSKTSRRKRDK